LAFASPATYGSARNPARNRFSTLKNFKIDFASGSALKNFLRIFPNETGLFPLSKKKKQKLF